MRILFVNDVALSEGWGAELHISRLIDGLRRQGDEVEIFAGEVKHEGISMMLDAWDPIARRALARIARDFRPDVVHHHNVIRELSVSVLGVPASAAAVLTVHDLRLFGAADGPVSPMRRRAIALKSRFDIAVARRQVDVAVGVSREVVRHLREAGFSAVEYLPAFAPAPPEPAVAASDCHDVVFAGRLTRDKGAHVLVEAFARVSERYPDARLVMAGDGPEGPLLKEAARSLGERVRFLGRVSPEEVAALMGRARVVVAPVLPHLRPEGAGMTVIEAALAGRPSIASDDPALREPIDAAKAGLVVEPGSVDGLAAALDRLLGNGELADRMGRSGRRMALQRHTTEAAVTKMRDIYKRATDGAFGQV